MKHKNDEAGQARLRRHITGCQTVLRPDEVSAGPGYAVGPVLVGVEGNQGEDSDSG